MKHLKLFFACLLMTVLSIGQVLADPITVTKTVHDIYPNDANGTQECTLWNDGTLSISVNKKGNNGKVYGTGTEWRLYQGDNAVVTVEVTSGELSSVTFSFSASNNGMISYGNTALTSGTAVNVSGTSATFTVGNTGTATNGQIKITEFSVTYTINSSGDQGDSGDQGGGDQGDSEESGDGVINFGSVDGRTNVNSASVTGDDSRGKTWTITTVGTTSFTANQNYSQVGSSSKPASSLTFTTTLSESKTISAFEAKFGGFSGTAGTVTLTVGETTVGTGSLNGTSDVTVPSTTSATGTVLTVTVTGISKGVKAYYISYTVAEGGTPQPTVSAVPNDNSYGSVEVSGMTITADPNDGYRVIAGDGGYNVTEGEAEVTNNGDNTFTVNATEDCTIRINFEAIPAYTVTFDAGTGNTLVCNDCVNNALTEASGNAGVTLPTATPSSNCGQAGWEFYGWSESAVTSTTNEPTLVEQDNNGKYYPTGNCILHAVYKVVDGASGTTKTVTFSENGYSDGTELTTVNIGSDFASVTFNKGTNNNTPKYYSTGTGVRCYGGNYFTVSANSGDIAAITLTFGSGENNNAITADAGTYSNGSWTAGNVQTSSVKFTIDGTSGHRRVASIDVTIGDPGTTTYNSNPSCEAPSVQQPTFDLEDEIYTSAQTLHLSSTSDGAVIYYNITNDGTNPDEPTNASTLYVAEDGISLDARKTYKVKAIAYVGLDASSVVSKTYTINLPFETAVELQEAATSTKKSVQVVFDEWVVTHVYTKNSKNYVYMIDEENHGLVIYGNESDLAFAVGDRLSGTVTAGLQKYNGVTELLDMTKAMVTTVTEGSVNPTVVTDFSTINATNEGALVTLEGATYNSSNTTLSNATGSVTYYNTFALAETPANGTKYDFTGIITKHNSDYQIAPRSAADMVLAPSTEYNVNSTIEGCTADANNPTTVSVSADALELVYALTEGYKWGTPVVTMGSVTLTEDDYIWEAEGSAGTLTITPDAFTGAINVELICEEDYGDYTFYDFSKISDFSTWSNSYTDHEVNYAEAKVTLKGSSKQTGTITDYPVTKGGDVVIVLNDNSKKISEIEFTCQQWSDKAQTITLNYSTDGGETYQTMNPSVTSSTFKIDNTSLPGKTNAVKFTFSSSSNQVGIVSAKLLIEELASSQVTLATNDANLGTLSIQGANESGNYDEGTQLTILSHLETGCKLENVELSEDNGGATLSTDNENNTILTVGSKAVTVTGTFARYYTVSFNTQTTDEVTGVPENQEVKAGEPFTIPTELLTREGKVFKGWNTTATAETGLTDEITVEANIVLYAIWADPADCTISFFLNGTLIANETKSQGTTYSVTRGLTTEQLASIPEGYTFEGWSTVPFGTYQNAFTPVTSITIPAETTLAFFAVFSRESQAAEGAGDYKKVTSTLSDWSGDYLIVYEEEGLAFNGGLTTLDAESNTISMTISDGTIAQSATVDAASFRIAANENAYSIKSKSGYYIGQTSDANGLASSTSQTYNNTITIADGHANIISGGAYLRYNSTSGQTRFRYYKSSSYSSQKAIQLYKKETGVTIYTTNAVEVYTITYNANGGTGTIDICTPQEIGANQSVTLCNTTLTKRGYTFAGWNTEANPTSENPGTSYTAGQENCMFTANTTLYAKWAEAESYHVTYVTTGATGATPTDETVYYDGDYVTLDDASGLSLDGYVFQGWQCGNQIYEAGSQDFVIHSNVTFTAVWTELAGDKYVLVTNASNLSTEKVYVIAASGTYEYAMGAQNSNNRRAVVVAKKSNVIYAPMEVATFKLESAGDGKYAIKENKEDNAGYLYAAGGGNTLKTRLENDNDDNGKWTITISTVSDVVTASISALQSSNNNVMQFNNGGSKLFSCYGSASQKGLALYEKVEKYTVSSNQDDSSIPDNADVVVESGQTLTLTGDQTFSGLLVEDGSIVDLRGNILTVPEFRIEASQVVDPETGLVNPSSGQFKSPSNLNAPEASFDLRVTMNAFDWFAFAVPFQVDVTKIRFIDDDDHVVTTPNHDIIYYDEAIRATNGYSATKSPAWQYITTGNLMPGVLYMIAVDNVNFTKLRFPKATGAIYNMPDDGNLAVSFTTSGAVSGQNGWNGIANPALSNICSSSTLFAQTYKGGAYEIVVLNNTTFVVGTPFFVQATSAAPIVIAEGNAEGEEAVVLAPNRVSGMVVERIAIELKRNGIFNDRLFVSASEDATHDYTIGRDVQKMGVSSRRGQMWVNNYNMKLCANEAPLVNNQAMYSLSLYAPVAGTYSLSAAAIDGADMYVTYEGQIIWNLSLGEYELDLAKGTTTGYGLLLVAQPNQMPTGVENGELLNGENGVQKILLNGQLYILRDGHLYDAVGKEMK